MGKQKNGYNGIAIQRQNENNQIHGVNESHPQEFRKLMNYLGSNDRINITSARPCDGVNLGSYGELRINKGDKDNHLVLRYNGPGGGLKIELDLSQDRRRLSRIIDDIKSYSGKGLRVSGC